MVRVKEGVLVGVHGVVASFGGGLKTPVLSPEFFARLWEVGPGKGAEFVLKTIDQGQPAGLDDIV